jgi:hypothetical protein
MPRTGQIAALMLVAAALLLSGCIQIEKKEYRFTIKPDGSGQGMVRYINIVSTDEDGKDVSFKDYATLITDYLNGTKIDEDLPKLHITGKKLLEENNQLVAEIEFTFGTLDSAGFFGKADCKCCPMIYFVKTSNGTETVTESNGQLVEGVADSPFLTWPSDTKDFTFKTTCLQDTAGARSLLAHYRTWKDKK